MGITQTRETDKTLPADVESDGTYLSQRILQDESGFRLDQEHYESDKWERLATGSLDKELDEQSSPQKLSRQRHQEDDALGFTTSEHLLHTLSSGEHEKYFRLRLEKCVDFQSREEIHYFLTLYKSVYLRWQNEANKEEKKLDFLGAFEKWASEQDISDKQSRVALSVGIRLALEMLRDLSEVKGELIENPLRKLYEILRFVPAQSLFANELWSFELDTAFDDARELLIETMNKPGIPERIQLLCVKTLVRMGIARANVEDYLAAANLIRAHPSLAYDLRDEIKDLHVQPGIKVTSDSQSTSKSSDKLGELKLIKTLSHVLGKSDTNKLGPNSNFKLMCTDGKHLYSHNAEKNWLKKCLLPEQPGDALILVDERPFEAQNPSLCYIKGKLYLVQKSEDAPLQIFDANSLALDREASKRACEATSTINDREATLKLAALSEEADEGSYRVFGQLRTICTDGTHLYTLNVSVENRVQDPHQRQHDSDSEEQSEIYYSLVVEQWCPETWTCLKQMNLRHKDETGQGVCLETKDFETAQDMFQIVDFATNGKILYGRHKHDNQSIIIDISGEQSKVVCVSEKGAVTTDVVYDALNNLFTGLQRDKLFQFSLPAFGRIQLGGQETTSPVVLISSAYLEGYESPQRQSVVLRKIKRVPVAQQQPISTSTPAVCADSASFATALILEHLRVNCEDFLTSPENHKPDSGAKIELKLSQFHSKDATYSTSFLFENLISLLQSFTGLIDADKSAEPAQLAEQVSFLNTITVLRANLKSLGLTGLSLSQVLSAEDKDAFWKVFNATVNKIYRSGYREPQHSVCASVWRCIRAACYQIMADSYEIINDDEMTALNELTELLSNLANLKADELDKIAFLLKFVSTGMLKLVKNAGLIDIIFSAWQELNSYLICKQTERIQSVSLFSRQESTVSSEHSAFEIAAERFVHHACECMLSQQENLAKELLKKAGKSEAELSKRRELIVQHQKLLSILKQMVERVYDSFGAQIALVRGRISSEIDVRSTDEWDASTIEYFESACHHLNQVMATESHLFMVKLFTSTIGIICLDQPSLTGHVQERAYALLSELGTFCQFFQKHIQKLIRHDFTEDDREKLALCKRSLLCIKDFNVSNSDCQGDIHFVHATCKNILICKVYETMGKLQWMLCFVAKNLMLAKATETKEKAITQETPTERLNRLFMKNKILSGGIDTRFVSSFSTETKEELRQVLLVLGSEHNFDLDGSEPNLTPDDKLLADIMTAGRNREVDQLIDVLQCCLEHPTMRCMHAKQGGADALMLSRATFAVMIKFASYSDLFCECLNELELAQDGLEPDLDTEAQTKALRLELKDNTQFKKLLNEWHQSSNVRLWLIEKKKNKSLTVATEVKQAFVKELKQLRDKRAKDNDALAEESKEETRAQKQPAADESDEETAGPTEKADFIEESKDNDDAEASSEVKLTSADKAELLARTERRTDEIMQEIFGKICAKAAYLLKMQVPLSYKYRGSDSQPVVPKVTDKEKDLKADEREKSEATEDWKDKLKRWKSLKAEQGEFKSEQQLRNEIFDRGNSSILSCLLTPVTAETISKNVESDFIRACRRVNGLKLLSRVIALPLTPFMKLSAVSFFMASLREGENNFLTHYLHNIKICSQDLEKKLKEHFFAILASILNAIKESRDSTFIKSMINALVWKYTGRDHDALSQLGIFSVLQVGNGDLKHPIRQAWGKYLKQMHTDSDQIGLDTILIKTFEGLFFNVISRVVQDDLGASIQAKTSGTSVLAFERSKSLLHTNVSQGLVSQAFQCVFSELTRYNNIMGRFGGFDWTLYMDEFRAEIKEAEISDYVQLKERNSKESQLLDLMQPSELAEAAQRKASETKLEAQAPQAEKQPSDDGSEAEGSYDAYYPDDENSDKIIESSDKESSKSENSYKFEQESGSGHSEKSAASEKPKNESAEKIVEYLKDLRTSKNFTKLDQLYSDAYLRRLLRLLEIFTSLASTNEHACKMMLAIVSPDKLHLLFTLYERTHPRNQITILKIVQHLIKVGIPEIIFDKAVEHVIPNESHYESSIRVKSGFISFYLRKLWVIRAAAYDETVIASENSYEVSQEIATLLNTIMGSEQACYVEWVNWLNVALKEASLSVAQLSLVDRDVLFALIQADYQRMGIGRHGLTEDNHSVTVLGYLNSSIKNEDEEHNQDDSRPLQFCPNSSEDQLKCLYTSMTNRQQQELMQVMPHTVKPLKFLDRKLENDLAEKSVTGDKDVISHFFEILCDPKTEKLLQSQILSFFLHIKQFKPFQDKLMSQNVKELCNYLLQTIFAKSATILTQSTPIFWTEARIASIKAYAIERSTQLQRSLQTCRCKVANQRHLVFTFTDESSGMKIVLNAPILSSYNMRKVTESSKFQVITAQKIKRSALKNQIRFVEPESLNTLDSAACKLMSKSEALITHDVNLKTLLENLAQKCQVYNDAPHNEKKTMDDWIGAAECIIFVVEKQRFIQVRNQQHNFNLKEQESKRTKNFDSLQALLKEWANIEIDDQVMYQLCTNEKQRLTYNEVITLLPALLSDRLEQLKAEQARAAQLKNTDTTDALQKQNAASQTKDEEARRKKIAEVLAEGTKFAFVDSQLSVIDEILPPEKESKPAIQYELLDKARSEDLELALMIKGNFWEPPEGQANDDENASQRSQQEISKMFFNTVYDFDKDDLQQSFTKSIESAVNLQAGVLLLFILQNTEFETLASAILDSEEEKHKLSLYLKSLQFTGFTVESLSGQNNFSKMVKNFFISLLQKCLKHERYACFAEQFLRDYIVQPGLKALESYHGKKAEDYKKVFNSAQVATQHLHPSLLIMTSNLYLELGAPCVLAYLPQLFTLAIGQYFKLFPKSDKTHKKLIYLCENILYFAIERIADCAENGTAQRLLDLKIVSHLCQKVDFDQEKFFRNGNIKRVLTLLLLQSRLHETLQQQLGRVVPCALEIPQSVAEVKKSLTIVGENGDSTLLKYSIFNESLSADQKEIFNLQLQSLKPTFDVKTRGKLAIDQVDYISVLDKCDLKPHTFVGLSRYSDGRNMITTSSQSFDNENALKINSNSLYVFYPIRKQAIVAMGLNTHRVMTEASSNSEQPAHVVKQTESMDIVKVAASRFHNLVLTRSGELYMVGKKCGEDTHNNYKLTAIPTDSKTRKKEEASRIYAGARSFAVIMKSGRVFLMGKSRQGSLPKNNSLSSLTEIVLPPGSSVDDRELCVDVACGNKFHLFVTSKGKLWGFGEALYNLAVSENNFNSDALVPYAINLPGDLKALRAWASQRSHDSNIANSSALVIFILFETPTGEQQLWSIGQHNAGLLGQGKDVKETKKWAKVDYDSSAIRFVDLSVNDNHVHAIDQDNQLWAWGSNKDRRCGLAADVEEVFSPTKVALNLNIKPIKVKAGTQHSLILCEDTQGQRRLYSIGQKTAVVSPYLLGCTAQDIEMSVIRKMQSLAECEVDDFDTAWDYNLICIRGENPMDGLYDHKVAGDVWHGAVHAYHDGLSWKFVSQADYEKSAGKDLPPLCLAFKTPIPNMEEVFAKIDPKSLLDPTLLDTSAELNARYRSSLDNKQISDTVYCSEFTTDMANSKVYLSESEYLGDSTSFDIHPLIYYRLKHPLKEDCVLPAVDLTQFYARTSRPGYELIIKPNFDFKHNDKLVEIYRNEYDQLCDNLAKCPEKYNKELLKEMEKQFNGDIESDFANKVDVRKMEFNSNSRLNKIPTPAKEARVKLLAAYNMNFIKAQKLASLRAKQGFKGQKTPLLTSPADMSMTMNQFRQMMVKLAIQNLNDKNKDQANVTVNRNQALLFEESGKVDHEGCNTIFGQVFQQVKNQSKIWHKNKPDKQAMKMKLEGEEAADAGGPYRETFVNMVLELEKGVLPLLVKTANNRTNSGSNRNCFLLNPDSKTPTHQAMFEFLGNLIGHAFRSNNCISFNFPTVFWKQIMDIPLEEKDVSGIDQLTHSLFKTLRENAAQITDNDTFKEVMDQTFTEEHNGVVVELCPGGAAMQVDRENLEEYIRLLTQQRLYQSRQQVKWVQRGIEAVTPLGIFRSLTPNEVDDRVCGMKELDINKLKSITAFENLQDDSKLVKWFWQILERMEPKDQTMYLRFVWGRARLPLDLKDLRHQHKLCLIEHWDDQRLPEAHTCFFALDIPPYKNIETFESKLLTSIRFCGEIDNDR